MKKIIRLTESDLTRLIKRVVSEAVTAPEPVVGKSMTVKIYFSKEGESVLADNTKAQIKNWLRPYIKMSMPTIKQFYRGSEFKLPKVITVAIL
jgi:ribosomal protein L30E